MNISYHKLTLRLKDSSKCEEKPKKKTALRNLFMVTQCKGGVVTFGLFTYPLTSESIFR